MTMRFSADHKRESRQRIVRSAATQFRARGAEAVRVADVMQSAGMTHGGFYKHFEDKDELLGDALAAALDDVCTHVERMTNGLTRAAALRAVIAFYLSEEHLEHPEAGCALAALGTEIARMPGRVKSRASAALEGYASRLDVLMPGRTRTQRRNAFLVLFPSMAGCMMTARAYADRKLRRRILTNARTHFTRAFCGRVSSTAETPP